MSERQQRRCAVEVLVRSNPRSQSFFSGIDADMRQAKGSAFFVPISAWNFEVSGGRGAEISGFSVFSEVENYPQNDLKVSDLVC